MPLAEHDRGTALGLPLTMVSIHVPLAEHDSIGKAWKAAEKSFNSRAPRGARRVIWRHPLDFVCFNSRAPRGARPPAFVIVPLNTCVSIHVPLAEHDNNSYKIRV